MHKNVTVQMLIKQPVCPRHVFENLLIVSISLLWSDEKQPIDIREVRRGSTWQS